MANLYGVANPNPAWVFATILGGANVVCPAGVETNIISVALNPVLLPGQYTAMCFTQVAITVGASPLTFLAISSRIGTGSDITSVTWPGIYYAAATNSSVGLYLPAAGPVIQNPPAASTLFVSLNPTGGPVTAQQFGTIAYARWEFAPPQ